MEQIARLVGVATSTYREWENGRAISGQPYTKIAQALDVSLYQLFNLEDKRKNEITTNLKEIEQRIKEIRNIL